MKKIAGTLSAALLVCMLAASAASAGENSAPAASPQPRPEAQAAPRADGQPDDKDGEWVESSVSQRRIDAVMKREERIEQRDEKLKIRERNVQSEETANPNNLFRRSR
ncbi:MAG: hypothetical protein OHK006_21020 [Thermodesulfovibrionales bacterium]